MDSRSKTLDQAHYESLLEPVESLYQMSSRFNLDLNLRNRIHKEGWSGDSLPGLGALQQQSLKVYIKILFLQYFIAKQGNFTKFENTKARVFDLCASVISDFVQKNQRMESLRERKERESPLIEQELTS